MQLSTSLRRKGKLVIIYFVPLWLIDWYFISFTARLKIIIHLYGLETSYHCLWGMQNVGTCFAPTAIKSRKVTLLCHICFNMGPWFLRSHSKNGPNLVSLYDNQGILRTYSNPDPDQMFSLLTCTIILYMYAMWKAKMVGHGSLWLNIWLTCDVIDNFGVVLLTTLTLSIAGCCAHINLSVIWMQQTQYRKNVQSL